MSKNTFIISGYKVIENFDNHCSFLFCQFKAVRAINETYISTDFAIKKQCAKMHIANSVRNFCQISAISEQLKILVISHVFQNGTWFPLFLFPNMSKNIFYF